MISQSERAGQGGQVAQRGDGALHVLVKEQAAPTEAEAANGQLRALQALTDTALSHLALDDLLREVLGRVTAVMGVENIGIFLLDEDGRALILRAARGLLEEDVDRGRVALGQGVPGRIAASRQPVIADAVSAFDVDGTPPKVREQVRSIAGVPLLVEDHRESRWAA
jgi:signal transduction protein with GAF and PtsI domain